MRHLARSGGGVFIQTPSGKAETSEEEDIAQDGGPEDDEESGEEEEDDDEDEEWREEDEEDEEDEGEEEAEVCSQASTRPSDPCNYSSLCVVVVLTVKKIPVSSLSSTSFCLNINLCTLLALNTVNFRGHKLTYLKRLLRKKKRRAIFRIILFYIICHPTIAGDSTNVLLNFTLHDANAIDTYMYNLGRLHSVPTKCVL